MHDLVLSGLPDLALLHLRGQKIAEFLQGQLTCDLRRLSKECAVAGALCNVKGRVIADLWVLAVNEEHCLLSLRASVATGFADHLRRYAQFSRISVDVDPRPLTNLGVSGPEDSLETLFPGPPGNRRAIKGAESMCIGFRSGSMTSLVAVLPDADVEEVHAILTASNCAGESGNPDAWHAAELASGHYAIEAEDQERYTPQALNYDLTGRVAFDKGCYTGQEVVARLHYKGESKRRLSVYRSNTPLPPDVTVVSDNSGSRIGDLLRILPGANGTYSVAAMIGSQHIGAPAILEGGISLEPAPTPKL